MTEVESKERALIYDVSLNKFPKDVDEAADLGKSIVIRQGKAQDRLIDVTFKKVFGLDMTDELNAKCNAVRMENDTVIIFFEGRPFLEMGDMIHEDVMGEDEMRRKIYLEYKVLA